MVILQPVVGLGILWVINSLTLQSCPRDKLYFHYFISYKLGIYYRRLLHNIIVGDSKKFIILCVIFHVAVIVI